MTDAGKGKYREDSMGVKTSLMGSEFSEGSSKNSSMKSDFQGPVKLNYTLVTNT